MEYDFTVLPPDLEKRVVLLGEEPSWVADDALEVSRYLARSGQRVVGLELFQMEGGVPKWIATSNYGHELDGTDAGPAEYMRRAMEFIERFRDTPGGLICFGAACTILSSSAAVESHLDLLASVH